MAEVLLDALLDTLKLVPLLLAVHLLISFFEAGSMKRLRVSRLLAGKAAPLLGTGVALLPQCGFSVIAGELYSRRRIRVGTLAAVFIATSDEAVPILLGSAAVQPEKWADLGLILLIKIIMALLAGYTLNFLFRKRELADITEEDGKGSDYGCCGHAVAGAPRECAENPDGHAHGHGHGDEEAGHAPPESRGRHVWHTYFKHPLLHTLKISLYILAVNVLLGLAIFGIDALAGENAFEAFMTGSVWFQPAVAVLVGLIPNCAASVVVTEMFVAGTLSLGAAAAGLSVNAGIGLAVLMKENRNLKENIAIVSGLVAYALAAGYIITGIAAIGV